MNESLTESWVRTAADRQAVSEGCYFDLPAAERVRDFFLKFLRHSKGEWGGQPFELIEWQWKDVIAPLFGWKRPDGLRRFRKAYIEIPKKNGKSTLASGIGLYLLVADGEHGPEVYSAAADQAQASIVHSEAVRMVKASTPLQRSLRINESTKTISFPGRNGVYRALSAGADTKEGLNANALIIDELHIWKGRQMWDALRYAGRARRQPLLFVITTAGDDLLSVCREQHDYAQGILRGQILDTRTFAYIRAADVSDDWTQPATWHKANPSLGVTMTEEDFAADVKEAEKTPTSQSSFKRYSLNIWATSTNPWLRLEDWSRCQRSYTAEDLAGCPCYGGLDLASVRDLTAFVLCFPWDEDLYRILPFFWLPEDTVSDPDSPEQYRVWAAHGYLRTTPGNVCDYAVVKRDIVELSKQYQILEYAYDPWNAEKTTQELQEENDLKRIAFPQTISNYAAPTREWERLCVAGKLHHPGHPVLTWMAGHVQVRTDPQGNMRPVKPPQGDRRKIDGISAGIMALGRAMLGQDERSVYETRGIECL